MNRLRYVRENYHARGIFVFIIIFGLIFTKTLLPLPLNISSQEQNPSPDKLVDNGLHIAIPRLMNHLNSLLNHTNEFSLDLTSSSQESKITPSFEIGNQIGTGGGVYQAYDSANLTSSMNLDVDDNHWRVHPEEHENSLTITIPTGYTNQTGYFNISGVTALLDWRLVENDTSGVTQRLSNSFYEAAQEFRVDESDLNLTKIYLYIDMVDDDDADGQKPNGEFLVVGDNSGEPDSTDIKGSVTLETHPTLAGLSDGGDWSAPTNGWLQYSFSPGLHLTKGTYWLVLNDTGEGGAGYWSWYTQDDGSGNPDKGEWNYKLLSHSGAWTEGPNLDMVIMPQVLPVELINSNYLNKKYPSPNSLEFSYQTSEDQTNLTSFTWFEWNGTSDNNHYFLTNTSVNFTISWRINITYSNNPLPITASYLTVNNSMRSQWNLTFTTASITTSYNIRNRTITVNGLGDDWNGSSISHGGFLEYNTTPSGGLNASVIYSNQSTPMIINASTLAAATDWIITFDAPNYVLGFNISLGGTPLGLPYQIFTMNDYYLDFKVGETGNLTYWIDYPNGSQRLKYNINNTHTVFSDLWDIDTTFDNLSNVNGTYYLQAFWNNSDSTKVGTYTREVSMIVNSTFDYSYETEVVLDTNLNIMVYYNSTHNTTVINGANVSGIPSWGSQSIISFNHTLAHDPYTFSLEINNSQHNPGDIISVEIYAELSGYVSNSTTINVKVVSDATLNTNISQNFVIEWRENKTIEIKYNETGGSGIYEATIAVDGDSTSVYNISDVYYYRFNATDPKYGGVSSHLNLNITASHTNYLTKIWYFDLTITPGKTNITASIDGNGVVTNNTPGTQIYYADSSSDHVSILLRYYHNLTNYNLSSVATKTIESTPLIPLLDSREGPDSTWNLTFNPAQNNIFTITITFNLTNYANAAFIFILEVLNARTEIETDFLNNTQVFYRESFDFSTFFNNTDWNENITFDGQGPISISSPGKIQYLNRTGVFYWFRFAYNPLVVGISTHSVSITFTYANFDSSTINVIFDVVKSPFVDIDGTDALTGSPLSNFTSTYTKHFSPNEYDNFSISLSYYANKTTEILTTTPSVSLNITIGYTQAEQLNHNWTFIFNGSALGTFLIHITFSHENYSSMTFTIQYIIQPADSNISEFSSKIIENPSPGINATVKSGNTIVFWLVWQSEYGEYLNDTNGVVSNNTALLIFIDSDTTNGTHYFQFTAGSTGINIVTLTFETINYTAIEITLRFQVTDRGLNINNDLSTHPDGWTSPVGYLQYGDLYYFHVIINDSETGNPVNISTFTGLPTNVTWVNLSSGDHLFCYRAWTIATITPIQFTIQFVKSNYVSNSTTLSFFVKVADSELFSAPSSISTYYSLDKNFSLIWQSVPNAQIPTSSVLRINSSTVYSSHSWVIFQDYDNGNYSFLIQGDIVGIFSVNIYFNSTWFNNIIYKLEISVLPIPTLLGLATSPSNFTIIGDSIPYFYFSEKYDLRVHWLESINNSGIMDTNVYYTGSGRDYLSPAYQVYTNGTHKFSIHANATGTYQIIIIFETNNFGELRYVISFIVSIMPTNPLKLEDIHYNHTVLVEDTLMISGEGYQTFKGVHVPSIDMITLWMNDSLVPDANLEIVTNQDEFAINFTTEGYHWGPYNLTLQLWTIGYQNQSLNLSINLLGREITITISLPGKTLEQGQSVKITASLNYTEGFGGGMGASVAFAALENINVTFYIGLQYQNESIKHLEAIKQTDPSGEASFTIDGMYTQFATGFTNITVAVGASQSGLHTIYSMSAAELDEYEIIYIFDPLEIIIPVIIIGVVILLIVGTVAVSGITLNRRRKRRSATIQEKRRKVEQSFEDIKSIRLLIARHESGLQFYSEKTIAELKTDTDALSGMSAAISSFMEEVSDGMRSRSEEQKEKDKIEVMSREGLHMLIWHGKYSSFIIISEVRLPDYFQNRLAKLGREVEDKFADDLQDFYRSDQIPGNLVKKMVRKHIPLHYFSAFILNEGVLTLESIKLSGKEKKMLKLIKEILFQKEGVQFFFSEQIISHLSKHFNRSETIKFLDRAIEINLLIEASQEDIISISK